MIKIISFLILLTPIFSYSAIELNEDVTQNTTEAEDSSYQLRQERKVGVGASLGGSLGLGGVKMDFGLFETDSVVLGFGGGSPFVAFSIEYKRILFGSSLLPYILGGYAHWETTSEKAGGMTKTSPDFVKDELMSEEDIRSGKISENLIYPGFGVQYYQRTGFLAGSSLYLEALLLTDIEDFNVVPAGSLGYLYYF